MAGRAYAGASRIESRQQMVTRVHSVADVNDHMREIWLRGPALAGWRCSPGAHVVVRVPAGETQARRVYSLWLTSPEHALAVLRVMIHNAEAPGCLWAGT